MIGELFSLYTTTKNTITDLLKSKKATRLEINNAIGAIRKAFNHTNVFLLKPDYQDKDKMLKLSDLWNEASEKVILIDNELGQSLSNKSMFWADYDKYVYNKMDGKIVSLDVLKDQIDVLMNTLRN